MQVSDCIEKCAGVSKDNLAESYSNNYLGFFFRSLKCKILYFCLEYIYIL